MRILIEECSYEATEEILEVVSGLGPTISIEGKVSVGYVGYYYNTAVRDCVFILPKVLLDKDGKAFGKHLPKDIVHLENKDNPLGEDERNFIYKLSVWIYRAIVVFKERNKKSKIVLHERIAEIGHGHRQLSNTFLDILLSLEQFYKDNQDFFFFVIKNQHSGHNKINWTKTITHSQAFWQDGVPIYLKLVNKRRQVNFDEELMVIYFSILNYIHNEYGFPFDADCHYELINAQQFKSFLKMGKTRLLEIKYKYFSDKALELWELCYAFFDEARQILVNTKQKEYLLVKDFEIVFEDIIDDLLGGKNDELPTELQEQPDGKRVDHLFRYMSLIEADNEKIYYIGDSKYYKRNTPIGKEALYKQFTYARNVIQWNIDLFLDEKKITEQSEERAKGTNILRDKVTEGYNIIPNFFISAKQNDLEMHPDIEWVDRNNQEFTSRQFDNRLFDRDTLLVCHYDVNFLYVVALYGKKNEGMKSTWRENVKKQFRREIMCFIDTRFDFFVLKSRGDNLNYLVEKHFKKLNGKIFKPGDSDDLLILALEKETKDWSENLRLLYQIEKDFHLYDYRLGTNPDEVKKPVKYQSWEMPLPLVAESGKASETYRESAEKEAQYNKYRPYHQISILFGIYKDKAHLDWILKNKKYNVRLGDRVGAVRLTQQVTSAEYLVLYEFRNEDNYKVYKLGDEHHILKGKDLKDMEYPLKDGGENNMYYVYVLNEETSDLGAIDVLATLVEPRKIIAEPPLKDDDVKGIPIYVYENDIQKK